MFKKLLNKNFISLVLCMVMLISIFGTAYAAVPNKHDNPYSYTHRENALKLKSTIKLLEKYVVRQKNGTFKLDLPKNIQKNIDTDILNNITASMGFVNSLIEKGKLKSTDSLTVYDPSVKNYSIQGNVNQIVWKWYGYDLYLDNTNTNKILADLAAGASADTILAAITGMVPGGAILSGELWIADGIIGLGAAAIMHANAAGNGIIISYLISGTDFIPFWVSSQ